MRKKIIPFKISVADYYYYYYY